MTSPTRQATFLACYEAKPQILEEGSEVWSHRANNFIVEVIDLQPGAVLERRDQTDEYMVVTTGNAHIVIEADRTEEITEQTLSIVPPGKSRLTAKNAGRIVRIFTSAAKDVAAQASNSAAYDQDIEDVAPLFYDIPPGGYTLRSYPLSQYQSVDTSKPFMLFRSAGLMVNIFKPFVKPRDTTKLSPHSHADFEQCSLALSGEFVHQLRYPWGPNLDDWRDDEKLTLDSPSMLTIPPNVIHTTYYTGRDEGWLIDIFGPVRADFVSKPGLVLNADDYPAKLTEKE